MASGGVPAGASPVDAAKKEAYYLRLHLLIVKEGTAILKARFDHSIPPKNLRSKLQEQRILGTIYYGRHKKNWISQAQYDFLYPPYKPPSSENFDISLLAYLLRNICGLQTKPNPNWWSESDNSKIPDVVVTEEADIARIRNLRNKMQHKNDVFLEEAEFQFMWDLAEKVMLRIATRCNIPDQKQKIDDIKDKQLDLVTEGMRSLRANTTLFLDDFVDDYQYVETAAFQKAKTMLEEKQIIILTGYPGEGKTTMAAILALEKSQPLNCLKLSSPNDWRKIDLSLKLFDTVIIDDIFGAGALDQTLTGEWRRYLPEIELAAKKKTVRVIITSRHYILEEYKDKPGSLSMFYNENGNVLHLTSGDLTEHEKTEILKIQATRNDQELSVTTIRDCIEASRGPTEDIGNFLFGFPECSSMFFRDKSMLQKGAQFFKKPATFFKRYLNDLYKENKKKFLALVAVWSGENKRLSRSEIKKEDTASEHIQRIATLFDYVLDKDFLKTMRASLDSHIGGYLVLSQATEEYVFSHNVIGDMVGLVIGKNEQDEAVKICPRDFLMEYVSIDEKERDCFKIFLEKRKHQCLAEKCCNMLLRNGCNSIAEYTKLDEFHTLQRTEQRNNDIKITNKIDFGIINHKAFSSENFVKEFINYVVQENLVNKVFFEPVMTITKGYFLDNGITIKQLDMCLVGYAWYNGAAVFAKEVIARKIIGDDNVDLSVSLLLATHSSQKKSIEFLLKHGAKVTGDAVYIASQVVYSLAFLSPFDPSSTPEPFLDFLLHDR